MVSNFSKIASFIWSSADLLRGEGHKRSMRAALIFALVIRKSEVRGEITERKAE